MPPDLSYTIYHWHNEDVSKTPVTLPTSIRGTIGSTILQKVPEAPRPRPEAPEVGTRHGELARGLLLERADLELAVVDPWGVGNTDYNEAHAPDHDPGASPEEWVAG